jgi:hypothetical protein
VAGKHEKPKKGKKGEEPEEALPGTAAMAQGQPGAGVEGEPEDAHPGQPDRLVTGGEALEVQQQDPELDDSAGSHP